VNNETMTMLRPHMRDGYRAARAGRPLAANPWRPETLGGTAWALGWRIGSLPWWGRVPMARALGIES